jgi:hypothetical protein
VTSSRAPGKTRRSCWSAPRRSARQNGPVRLLSWPLSGGGRRPRDGQVELERQRREKLERSAQALRSLPHSLLGEIAARVGLRAAQVSSIQARAVVPSIAAGAVPAPKRSRNRRNVAVPWTARL